MQNRAVNLLRVTGVFLAAALFVAGEAKAQAFPERAVEIVVGYSPGGLTDGVARVVAQQLSEAWGKPVVVQNRPGAGGTIAANTVANAKPDGYTLLLADHALMTYPSLYPSFPHDLLKAFQPLSVVGGASMVFLVRPDSPIKSLKDLVAAAKAEPGKVTFASGGTGTVTHLAGELFEKVTDIDLLHVPYRGVAPGITDLLGGRIAMMVSSIGPIVPQVTTGTLKALAVTGPQPVNVLPGVPTVGAAGYPDATAVGYWGFLAPANLPPAVLAELSKALTGAIRSPKTQEKLRSMGVDPVGSTPDEYANIVRSESTRWGEIIKRIGIKAE